MKLLIAYDGSDGSEAALDDLVRAGLPESCEVLVISVAEAWLPITMSGKSRVISESNSPSKQFPEGEVSVERNESDRSPKGGEFLNEARVFAEHAKRRLEKLFPKWQVMAFATYGSPAHEILSKAAEFGAELIIVGAHGRFAGGRFLLGSISQRVITEAKCSVRVGRAEREPARRETKLVIGFDGSIGSQIVVDAVANRTLPTGSKIKLVSAIEDGAPAAIGRFLPPAAYRLRSADDQERNWVARLAAEAAKKLRQLQVETNSFVGRGSPKEIIVDQAEEWNADCVYVGATEQGRPSARCLLGSTSVAVATRASCSVEIIRDPGQ